jgi:hypothetical protein
MKAREAELEQAREDTAERVAAKAKLALDLLKAKKARDIERVKKQEDKASKLAEKEALIAAALHAASLQTPPKKQRTLMQYNMFD